MLKKSLGCSLLVAGLSGALPTLGADDTAWSYAGEHGPAHWGELASAFATCETGKNQSPIDIRETVDGELPALYVHYGAAGHEIVNNGHTLQINYPEGNAISLAGRRYELLQAHFHTPSEHAVHGQRYPMEGHLVHADEAGNLAVIALMYERGVTHAGWAEAWKRLPEPGQDSMALPEGLPPRDLLPERLDYYRASGSLTTPPCTEGVRWLVMKQPVVASKRQIDAFAEAMGQPNNRPLQPLNARIVAE